MFLTKITPARMVRPALLLLLLLAFALRIADLDRLGMAYDEAASALMAQATPQEIVIFHWNAAFEHPPFWILLLHNWSKVAGQSEFALRLIPAYAGILIVALTWRLIRNIWPTNPLLAYLSAFYIATAPVLVYYSQEARMYTLVVMLMLVSILLILRLRQQPTWLGIISFWLICWAMLGLHYYAALGLAIQALVLIVDGFIRGPIRRMPWAKLFIAYLGATLPIMLWMLFSPGFHTTLTVVLKKASEDPVTWQYFLTDLWRELTFGSIRWQPDYATWGYAIAPLVLIGLLLIAIQRSQPPIARIGTWMIIAIVAIPIISGTIALRNLVPRYILWVVPPLYALAAIPAAKGWKRHWLIGTPLALIVITINILALQYYFGPYRKSEYRDMTQYLQSRGNPQDEIFIMEAPRQHLLAKYYLPTTWQQHPMPTVDLPPYWPITAPLIVPEDEDDRIQAWLTEYDGLWVSYTSEAEVDSGEFLAKYLTAVSFREHCSQWLDVRLCHYVSPHHLAATELNPTPILFGNELALLSVQGTFTPNTPESNNIFVQLDWHAQQKPTLDYKVALRLIAADGTLVSEIDDYPIGPLLPPTTWNQDDHKPGYFTLKIPTSATAGSYQIQLLLYDGNTLDPVPSIPLEATNLAAEPTTEPLTIAQFQLTSAKGNIPSNGTTDDTMGNIVEWLLPAAP